MFLTARIQNTVNIRPLRFILNSAFGCADAFETTLVFVDNAFHQGEQITVERLLPIGFGSKSKQFTDRPFFCGKLWRVLAQHIRIVRQTLHVGIHLRPVSAFNKFLKPFLRSFFVIL